MSEKYLEGMQEEEAISGIKLQRKWKVDTTGTMPRTGLFFFVAFGNKHSWWD